MQATRERQRGNGKSCQQVVSEILFKKNIITKKLSQQTLKELDKKLFEFRKVIFKENIKSVLVYSSSPVQKVIGEFQIGEIIKHDLETLWSLTKEHWEFIEEYSLKLKFAINDSPN